MTSQPLNTGPAPYALADWRRRINDLYAEVRAETDPARAWSHWHGTRSALFRVHPMSPLSDVQKDSFSEIPLYDYDPALRFAVDLIPRRGPQLVFDLGQDGTMAAEPRAQTSGLMGSLGAELTLYWITGYGGGLFLPFKDATNGAETYGGGRYLIDAIKGSDLGLAADGKLILDFNFAYSPSCALSEDYVCPLSPAENTLPVAVRGGEKVF
ncbi:MAG: DUF1684 domain-containing protein [Pseudomonadota bacterium]